jgi:hypothetical protein
VTARDSAYRDHPLRAYTVEEAADILSCDPGWLEELARERQVPYTELSGACHFTSAHLAAIQSAFEVLPPAGEPSQAAAPPPPPAELAHAADQAAAIIGGSCKGSWLKQQARDRKIPYTRIGGSYHFTDEQLAEIIRIFEVPARRSAAPAPASRAPSATRPAVPTGVPLLQAREPRKRGKP